MKLTPTIYNHYKKTADNAYMDMYHAILAQVIESEDLIRERENIADNIEGDSYTTNSILDLIAKLKQ